MFLVSFQGVYGIGHIVYLINSFNGIGNHHYKISKKRRHLF